jgi:hypothetical protein
MAVFKEGHKRDQLFFKVKSICYWKLFVWTLSACIGGLGLADILERRYACFGREVSIFTKHNESQEDTSQEITKHCRELEGSKPCS